MVDHLKAVTVGLGIEEFLQDHIGHSVKALITTMIKVKSCKEMGGATSVMPVIGGGAFSQWADTIDWTVRCDWLQVASVITFNIYLASFIVVATRVLTWLK